MKKESIYIAGPMCFYEDGYPQWYAMRDRAKTMGFQVTMPSEGELELDPVDLQGNGDRIFQNCVRAMEASTAILCNLEFYRGPDVDGGSLFEVGMAYAKGAGCYGYTRDKRPMVWKYQGGILKEGTVFDRKGRPLPFGELPFSPNTVGALKIVEGDFDDCLRVFALDVEEKRKRSGMPQILREPAAGKTIGDMGAPVVYLAGPERYDVDSAERYREMKALCRERGLYAIVPTDDAPGVEPVKSEDPYARAYQIFCRQQHVRNCDAVIANLNDFHGWEPDSDTSFECGMACQLGKGLFGYMSDTTRMIERIPNLGPDREYRDACGCNAENFDYPINLMFASSMPIYQGDFRDVIDQIAAKLVK